MSLIDSFTKPQWQHRKPEVRKTAIDQLDDQTVLVDLVNADPDPDVRSHALSRVPSACNSCFRTPANSHRPGMTPFLSVLPASQRTRN